MSASLIVDIGGSANFKVSALTAVPASPQSGIVVGEIIDLADDDTYTNIFVAGGPSSGSLSVAVQTSDDTTSGNFTDPTSGLATNDFPAGFVSGGNLHVNSGYVSGGPGIGSGRAPNSPPVSGATAFASGGVGFGAFQRPHRYARILIHSGNFDQPVIAGFVCQRRVTGSGGGFTFNPGSGVVQV